MSSYSFTRARIFQWMGIILAFGLIAVGYWYYQSQASTTINKNLSDSLATGLAGYWALDDGSGTSAADSSTNGNTGTLTNGPTWGTGQIGSAVTFDGSNDYITAGTSSVLKPSLPFSIAYWVKINSLAANAGHVSNRETNPQHSGFQIGNATDGSLSVTYGEYTGCDSSGRRTKATAASVVTTGQWYQITGVVRGATDMSIYVNGVDVGGTYSGSGGNIVYEAASFLRIGGAGGGGGCPATFLNGSMDDVRVYNRGLSANEAAQLYQLTSPTGVDTGLKGYWPFDGDDVSGTTAYDRSGVGNTGTLTNGPTRVVGKVGQAVSFDGDNDYFTVPTNTAYNVSNITVGAWIKTTTNGMIMARDVFGASRQFQLRVNGGVAQFVIFVGSGNVVGATGTTPINDNNWHHVVGTYDAVTAKVYVDGRVDASVAETRSLDTGGTTKLTIGSYEYVTDAYSDDFTGPIDEARYYNRALTVAEIKSLYDAGQSDKSNTSATQAQGALSLDSDLAGYWKLDDGTSGATPTTAADSSPVTNNGTLNGGPTWTTGRIGNAVSFDGSNDLITTSYTASQTSTRALTYAVWFAPGLNDVEDILGQFNGDDSSTRNWCYIDNMGAELNNPAIFCILGIAGSPVGVSGGIASPTDAWIHMVLTYDGTALKLYLNNQLISVAAQTGSIDVVADGGLIIGGGYHGYFAGKIDEVRMYTRALSADEVVALYNLNSPTSDSGLRGYWSLNAQDMSGTTAYDRSGAGNTGTLTNTPAKSTGVVGQGINFDGSDDYVSIADNATIDIGDTEDLTLTGWFNRDTITTDDTIIAKRNGIANTDDGYILYIDDTTDKLTFEVSENSGTDEYQLESTTTFGPGWNHFAIVWDQDSASESEIYLNGVDNNATDTGTIGNLGDLANSVVLAIGAESDAGNPFDGKLDELRVYKRALTSAEIKSQYDLGQVDKSNSSLSQPQGSGRLDSGLVNYWKFDENTGTSTTDSSTNAFAGTLTNGPTWTTGQIGSAINFDGSNDYVTATDSDDSKYTGEITLCVWANIETAGNYRHFMGKHASGGGTVNPFDFRTSTDNPPKMVLVRANADYRSYNGPDTVLGQWKHYCVVAPAAIETTPTFYLDGVPTTGVASGGSGTGAATGSGAAIRMGSRADATPLMDGSMDEVRIYNRMLSADEIGQIYRLGASTATDTSLKGYWSFNGQDMSGTTAYDRSGAGNTATLTGPTKTLGKIGQGISLDGSNDYASIPDANSIDYDYNQDFSFTTWVKIPSTQANTVAGDNFILEKWSGSGGYSYALRVYNQTYGTSGDRGRVVFRRYDGTNNPGVASTSYLNDNTWHHVAGVRNGAQLRIYVDGALQATATDTTSTTTTNTSPLYIGTRGGGSTNFFQGGVDELRIYNRTLTDAEVASIYNQSR